MIPVDQTTFGVPGGNCFSACVASLLELPIEEVPYFMGDFSELDKSEWWYRFLRWLKPHGFYALFFMYSNETSEDAFRGLCILGGHSPRGPHSVVGRGLDMLHDPHPSRTGIEKVEDITVLVPFDPAGTTHRAGR